jgi:hypothetical protein
MDLGTAFDIAMVALATATVLSPAKRDKIYLTGISPDIRDGTGIWMGGSCKEVLPKRYGFGILIVLCCTVLLLN